MTFSQATRMHYRPFLFLRNYLLYLTKLFLMAFLTFTQWIVFVKAIRSRHNTTLSPSGYFNSLLELPPILTLTTSPCSLYRHNLWYAIKSAVKDIHIYTIIYTCMYMYSVYVRMLEPSVFFNLPVRHWRALYASSSAEVVQ